MLNSVKTALRVTKNAFDTEIQNLIGDCLAELTMLGIYTSALSTDKQILTAVIFYCKSNWGNNPDAERWKEKYNDKVSKLMIATGYGGEPIPPNEE